MKISQINNFVRQEVAKQGLKISEDLSQNDYFNTAAAEMGMNSRELTNYLWNTYNPSNMWYVVLSIGLVSVLALYLYDRFLMTDKK